MTWPSRYADPAVQKLYDQWKAEGLKSEQAALKVLYLAVRSLDPKGTGQVRWITRWKPILNVIGVSFQHRMPEAANL